MRKRLLSRLMDIRGLSRIMDTDHKFECIAIIVGIVYCLAVIVFAVTGRLYG
jgi:hypothetical protein